MKLLKKGLKIYGILTVIGLAVFGAMQYVGGMARIYKMFKKSNYDGIMDESMRLTCVDLFVKD